MEKFCEICCIIIILILFYMAYTNEKRYAVYENFVGSFKHALETKEFNFKKDLAGWSQADKALDGMLNRV